MAYSPTAVFNSATSELERQKDRIRRLGLTARQIDLNRFWSYYSTTQHEVCLVDWNGRKRLTSIERDTVSRSAVLPTGFNDLGGIYEDLPLEYRKPVASYHLTRIVVNRFTELLFSARMHPKVTLGEQPDLQSWIENLVEAARLWVRFAHARSFGGGCGSVAVSFRFRNGRPVLDVHDPRWCTPTFEDHTTGEISALEIRYTYPVEERDEKGVLRENWYWYRRVIDAQRDCIYKRAPVGEGDEPFWIEDEKLTKAHGFGECPAVWIRNTQTNEVDGEPDCFGEFDTQDAIDILVSQAHTGAAENADPTLEVASDELKVEQIKKGSRNAFKLEKGASARYVEMTGSGVDSAMKVADMHRRNFLEVVQCILDSEESSGAMTATEIERRRESMHGRGDMFREQYGEMGVKPLIGKLVRAVLKMRSPEMATYDPATGLRLVPQVTAGGAALPAGIEQFTDDMIKLSWPSWVQRGAADAVAAAGAVATARSAKALDRKNAVEYLASYFNIEDTAKAIEALDAEEGGVDAGMMGDLQAAAAMPGAGPPQGEPPAPQPPQPDGPPIA